VGPCNKCSIAAPNLLLLLLPFIVRNCRDGGDAIRTLALGPGAELDSGQLGIITSKETYYYNVWRKFYY
jgi:hypothetical protein